jgi:hypothetical protein
VFRVSEKNVEVMVLRVRISVADGFGGVENVRKDVKSHVLWVGCVWGADVSRIADKEAVTFAFTFGAFISNGTEYRSMFGDSKSTVCSHAAVASRLALCFWFSVLTSGILQRANRGPRLTPGGLRPLYLWLFLLAY